MRRKGFCGCAFHAGYLPELRRRHASSLHCKPRLRVGSAFAADDVEPAADEMEDSVPVELPKVERPSGHKPPATPDGFGAIGRAQGTLRSALLAEVNPLRLLKVCHIGSSRTIFSSAICQASFQTALSLVEKQVRIPLCSGVGRHLVQQPVV